MKNIELTTAISGHNNDSTMATIFINRGKGSLRLVMKVLGMALIILQSAIFVSCEDMLQTESDRQIFDPALDQKTDSMFYTLGILKAVQQAADQYVLVNEMRGDLVATNTHTETDLQQLANFSATVSNKYDSAYVYYRIINNCNYFIAHRNTELYTGSRNVSMPEYVQAHSIRAWAYMQLAKTYGTVPFYTEPVTSITQANEVKEKKNLQQICDALAGEMEKYSGYGVPTYRNINAGSTNAGISKTVYSEKIMFPIDVVLGDMYLETGQYQKAARHYFDYLVAQQRPSVNYFISPYENLQNEERNQMPNDMTAQMPSSSYSWFGIFSSSSASDDIVTYVPMAVNRMKGTVTDLPRLFGFDYYSTEATNSRQQYLLERQIDASPSYIKLAQSQAYYYIPTSSTTDNFVKETYLVGDLRRRASFENTEDQTYKDSLFSVMEKYNMGNIFIYRYNTIYLRLAEAINRMGYPDAAFCILKDGFYREMANDTTYIKPETHQLMRSTIPFFSTENIELFRESYGIHSYGSGYTRGTFSPYQLDAIVGNKLREIAFTENITVGATKNDTINAVEDLICDEYALEAAFEGNRFGDLCRLARHKNESGLYGSNFGSLWLKHKLEYKRPVVDLSDPNNWYLPFSK